MLEGNICECFEQRVECIGSESFGKNSTVGGAAELAPGVDFWDTHAVKMSEKRTGARSKRWRSSHLEFEELEIVLDTF